MNITDLGLDLAHLTNLSQLTDNEMTDFGSEWVFPTVQVDADRGYWYKYSGDHLRQDDTSKGDFSDPLLGDAGLTSVAYGPIIQHQSAFRIPQRVLEQQKAPIELVQNVTRLATSKMFRDKEIRLAAVMADTSTITQYTTLSGVNQWNDRTSSPFDKIAAACTTVINNSGKIPNIMWMSRTVWEQLQNHPDLIDRVKASSQGLWNNFQLSDPSQMGNLFGIKEVRIFNSIYDSAKQGQTAVKGQIWGKHCWLAYRNEAPALMTTSAGYHLTIGAPRAVDVWYEQKPQLNYVRVSDYYEQKVIDASCVYLIQNAVA